MLEATIGFIPHSQLAASKSPSSSQGASLDVVANRVVEESGIVLGVNSGSDTGSSIVLCPVCESRGVNGVNSAGIYI